MAEIASIALEGISPCKPIVDLQAIDCRHDTTRVLQEITLKAFPGEVVVVTGASGAGKSTLLGLIHGDHEVAYGEAVVAGQELHRRRRVDLPRLRRDVGMVYQDYRLIPVLTALENIVFAIRANDPAMARGAALRRAGEALNAVGLGDRAQAIPGHLSGGEQQRVAIARAFAVGPRVLVADEPTGNLDRDNAREIIALLAGAARRGTLVLIATHDPALLRDVAARTMHLDRGRVTTATPLAIAR